MPDPVIGPYSITGRRVSYPPRLIMTSERACKASIRKKQEWLKKEAILEAKSRGDEWNLFMFERETIPMPQGIADCMCQYVFGHESPLIQIED